MFAMTMPRYESPLGGSVETQLPPRYPPEGDLPTRLLLGARVRRVIFADGAMAIAITAIVLCWAFPVSTVLGIVVLALRPRQLRLIDRYAAYYPGGCPERRRLDVAWALALVALACSAAGWALTIIWIAQKGFG